MDATRLRTVAASKLTARQLATLRSLLNDALVERRSQVERHEPFLALLKGDKDADTEWEVARIATHRAREAIEEVEHALARLDEGTYGTCESCGRPIPFERLEAVPEARYCVGCPRHGGFLR